MTFRTNAYDIHRRNGMAAVELYEDDDLGGRVYFLDDNSGVFGGPYANFTHLKFSDVAGGNIRVWAKIQSDNEMVIASSFDLQPRDARRLYIELDHRDKEQWGGIEVRAVGRWL